MTFAPFGLPADNVYVLNNGKIEVSGQGEFSIDSYDETEDDEWDPLLSPTVIPYDEYMRYKKDIHHLLIFMPVNTGYFQFLAR